MSKILVLTHGRLSDCLLETLNLFITDYRDVEAVNLNDDPEAMREKLRKELICGAEKDYLLLTDLFGGTPFNIAASLITEAREKGKSVELVSGVNLPMLLETVSNMELMSLRELKETAVEIGKFGIRDLMAELNKREESTSGR